MKKKFIFCLFLFQMGLFSIALGNMALIEVERQIIARIFIDNLDHQYNGEPKSVNVRTVPAGLNVKVTYNGDTKLPIDAGKYEVFVEVQDLFWRGSSTAEMIIRPLPATVSFGNIIHKYDGKPKNVSVTTSPAGLKTTIKYNPNPPINAGSYKVTADINEKNYFGSAQTDMIIEKAQANIVFEKLVELYDGSPKSAQIATEPKGLKITSTYNGSGSPPSKSGKYELKAVINEQNYTGQKDGVFIINTAPIVLGTKEIVVKEDAEPSVIDLSTIFSDPDEGDKLNFSVSKNTNENLISNIAISNDKLTLTYSPDAHGKAEITVKATDIYNASSESKIIVEVEPENDPPFLEIDDKLVKFVSGDDESVPIVEWVKITDPDDEFISGAQILFTRNYQKGQDLLIFEETDKIKGTFSIDGGNLNFKGIDTKENYENAIKQVIFKSNNFLSNNRFLTIYVDDGKASSNNVNKEIEVVDGFVAINIPTAFTPNNDHVNNTWKIHNLEKHPDATIKIFNRSGQLIFTSTENQREWDGTYKRKPAPIGSYYYVITIQTYGKVYTGNVTILR